MLEQCAILAPSQLNGRLFMGKINGFDRLKGLAAAGAISIAGMFGGNAARAASATIPLDVTRSSVKWSGIGNNNNFPSETSVTTTNGVAYDSSTDAYGIRDAQLLTGSSTFGDAFDNALILSVDGSLFLNPDSTVDLTGDTVTSDTVTIVPGIDAQVRYTFIQGRRVARGLFSLTNTTGAPISVNAAVLGDYGSDTSTTVVATSDGDTTIDGADLWYITDDSGTPVGVTRRKSGQAPDGIPSSADPRVTLSRYGTGAAVVPFNALTPGGGGSENATYGLRYPLTIAPGQTARLLVFMELSEPGISPAGAIASAADFTSLTTLQTAGLLGGLTATEIGQVVNYAQAVGPPPPPANTVDLPVLSPGGLLTLFGVIGGLGFFELRRRRQIKVG
jgi:hypothetical protein